MLLCSRIGEKKEASGWYLLLKRYRGEVTAMVSRLVPFVSIRGLLEEVEEEVGNVST